MVKPLSIAEPELRKAIDEALGHAHELLVFIRYTHTGGSRDWFLVRNQAELEQALARVTVRWEHSDAVELYATGELPYRERDDERLRAKALEILRTTDVVLACKRDGDAELHDVTETDQANDVDEWFRTACEGERLALPHPLLTREAFYPDVADAFLAYAPKPDGTVAPGAY
jgi:hypothetical protein